MKIDRIALPSVEELRALFQYNPKTGSLIWRDKPPTSRTNKRFNTLFAGKEAGTLESWGYIQIRINGKLQMAHRIIWKMVKGQEPPDHLDHKDGIPSNNRWKNLRESSTQSNVWNSPIRSHNTSGFQCIYPTDLRTPGPNKFLVQMSVKGKTKRIGYFPTLEEAQAAYAAAFAKYRDIAFKR